eukprot:gene117-4363_t
MKENTQYKVNIVGYITSLDNWNNKKTFYIDDSTGLLCCIYWINDFNEDIELQLGQKIGILGTVSIYNNFRQVKVYKTYPCSSLMECYFILNQTLGEALGYPKDARILIINADDYGMSHGENKGTEAVLECGMVKSTTMMMPCPWINEAIRYVNQRNLSNVGIHLTFTSEWRNYRWAPIYQREKSSLIDPTTTYMWETSKQVEQNIKIEHAMDETNAQLQRALKAGVDLSHFDSHMGSIYGMFTGRWEILAVAMSHAYAYGLPFRIPFMPKVKPFRDMGFAILDHLVFGQRVPSDPREHMEYHKKLIKNLKPGVTEFYIHPAIENDEMKAITASWKTRKSDMLTFCSQEMRDFIKQEKVILIDFKQLRAYQRKKMNWNSSFRASDVLQKYIDILKKTQ